MAPLLAARPGPRIMLRLVLLGRVEAWGLASTPVLPRARKARALLGILALAAGQPVPRARLAALLWSRSAEAQRQGSLRQALHEVHAALGEHAGLLLQSTREAVSLAAEHVWVDALEVVRAASASAPVRIAVAAAPESPAAAPDLLRPASVGLVAAAASGAFALLGDLDGLDPAFDAWLLARRRELRAALAGLPDGAAGTSAAGRGEAAGASAALPEPAAPPRPAPRGGGGAEPGPAGAPPPLQAGAIAWRRPAPPPAVAAARPNARGVRLGVLPPRMLGEGVAGHLPQGLAEAITAALSCFRWIFVADSASLVARIPVSGDLASAERAGRAMGLDFLLGGTVQAGGAGRLRLSFRLADLRMTPAGGSPGSGGSVIAWAQHFDRDATDLLALQDEVAAAVVARLDPEILMIEAARAAAAQPPRSAEPGAGVTAAAAAAHDLLLRAVPAIHRLDREEFLGAGRLLAEACRLEPGNAHAHAWHAYWHLFLVGQGWAEDDHAAMVQAESLAARATALDPLDAQGLTMLGHVRAYLDHRVEEAATLHRRALALNPNLAMAWVFLGMAESYLGEHESALRRLDRYRELAPCHPHAFFFDAARGIPLLLLGRHEEAVEVGRAVTALQPAMSFPYKTYLSALGHLGLREEAERVRARLAAIEPGFTVARALRRTPVRRADDRAHYASGLRRAGLR